MLDSKAPYTRTAQAGLSLRSPMCHRRGRRAKLPGGCIARSHRGGKGRQGKRCRVCDEAEAFFHSCSFRPAIDHTKSPVHTRSRSTLFLTATNTHLFIRKCPWSRHCFLVARLTCSLSRRTWHHTNHTRDSAFCHDAGPPGTGSCLEDAVRGTECFSLHQASWAESARRTRTVFEP